MGLSDEPRMGDDRYKAYRARMAEKRVGLCPFGLSWPWHNIVYVRVPKCANTSLRNALEGGREEKVNQSRLRTLYAGCKVFSFVRNPWARLVCGYNAKMSRLEFAEDSAARRLRKIDRRFRSGMPF